MFGFLMILVAALSLQTIATRAAQFPYNSCDADPTHSSLYVNPSVNASAPGTFVPNTFVFKLGTKTCKPPKKPSQSSCCKSDIDVFEIQVASSCVDTLAFAGLVSRGEDPIALFPADIYHPPSSPEGNLHLRIQGLGLTSSSAASTQITLTLQSGCTSLDQLCGAGGKCKVALYSSNGKCCPVSSTKYSGVASLGGRRGGHAF